MELYLGLKEAEGSTLYHHTHRFYRAHSFLGAWDRSDFALWTAQNLKEEAAAERMGAVDPRDYRTLEGLRKALLEAMEPLLEDKERWTRRVLPGLEFHFCKSVSLVMPTSHEARNLEGFVEALDSVDTSSLYYHLIEAPLHFHGERDYPDDFSQWLADSGLVEQAQAVTHIDPYRADLEILREDLLSVFQRDKFRGVLRRAADRLGREPKGEPAAQWLRRWRGEG
jgi:hypothetical protein